MTVDVRRSGTRARTLSPGVDSRHSLSFGRHYDPANTCFGVLLAHNEDRLEPGSGYSWHPHRDVEVVTWVLEGALVHRDSTGREHLLQPGAVQVMSAGAGIEHSETADAHLLDPRRVPVPVRFVQTWVVPDEPGGPPELARQDVSRALAAGGLVPVASGRQGDGSAVGLRCRSAVLHAARLRAQESVPLPAAPYVHLFVARGTATVDDAVALGGAAAPDGAVAPGSAAALIDPVVPGSAAALRAGDAVRLRGGAGLTLTARSAAEVLVWEMHAGTA